MKFTKEHTMQMKGIAIIILLFHHCFLNAQRWATVPYEKLATTKGWGYYPISFAPFSSHTIQYLASFSKICVAMFVFMTGYGMWVSYETFTSESDTPPMVISPVNPLFFAEMIPAIVLLPHPDSPTRDTKFPAGRYKSIPFKISLFSS